jgi:hypothetical protein
VEEYPGVLGALGQVPDVLGLGTEALIAEQLAQLHVSRPAGRCLTVK